MPDARLSPREDAVLRACVRHGGSIKLAAHELGLAPQTVRNMRHNAYRKLDVQTLVGAMVELGWVTVPA